MSVQSRKLRSTARTNPTGQPRKLVAALSAATLLLSPLALAGTATMTSSDGGTASFEYDGKLLRINTEEEGAYMVVREGNMYVVNTSGDQPMVFNASSMMRGMAQNAVSMAPEELSDQFESLEDTGRDETVAGVKGDVYLLTTVGDEGRRETREIVLSKDPRALELNDALFVMVEVAGDIAGKEAVQESRDLQGRLADLDAGVLRVGDDMRITSISGDKVAAARFALPAEPMDMQGLGSMIGAAMSQQPADGGSDGGAQSSGQQGGLLGGMLSAFGKQAEEDTTKAAEEEVEEEAKSKNPFKALGKLFGDRE